MDINSKKPVGLGTNVSFSHGCFVDWASVPAGFDWVVICERTNDSSIGCKVYGS